MIIKHDDQNVHLLLGAEDVGSNNHQTIIFNIDDHNSKLLTVPLHKIEFAPEQSGLDSDLRLPESCEKFHEVHESTFGGAQVNYSE